VHVTEDSDPKPSTFSQSDIGYSRCEEIQQIGCCIPVQRETLAGSDVFLFQLITRPVSALIDLKVMESE
jgi:hypothetical protein